MTPIPPFTNWGAGVVSNILFYLISFYEKI